MAKDFYARQTAAIGFRGVDNTSPKFQISDGKALDSLNYVWRDGAVRKRYGTYNFRFWDEKFLYCDVGTDTIVRFTDTEANPKVNVSSFTTNSWNDTQVHNIWGLTDEILIVYIGSLLCYYTEEQGLIPIAYTALETINNKVYTKHFAIAFSGKMQGVVVNEVLYLTTNKGLAKVWIKDNKVYYSLMSYDVLNTFIPLTRDDRDAPMALDDKLTMLHNMRRNIFKGSDIKNSLNNTSSGGTESIESYNLEAVKRLGDLLEENVGNIEKRLTQCKIAITYNEDGESITKEFLVLDKYYDTYENKHKIILGDTESEETIAVLESGTKEVRFAGNHWIWDKDVEEVEIIYPSPNYYPENEALINGCTTIKYWDGILWFSGNPNAKNKDWHSDTVSKDLTFIDDLSVAAYGNSNQAIVGYGVVSENRLMVLKESRNNLPTVYYRQTAQKTVTTVDGTIVIVNGEEAKERIYQLIETNITIGGISNNAIVEYRGDLIFLTNNKELSGLDSVNNSFQNEKVITSRSQPINHYLHNLTDESFKNIRLYAFDDELYIVCDNAIWYSTYNDRYDYFKLDSRGIKALYSTGSKIYFGTDEGYIGYFVKDYFSDAKITKGDKNLYYKTNKPELNFNLFEDSSATFYLTNAKRKYQLSAVYKFISANVHLKDWVDFNKSITENDVDITFSKEGEDYYIQVASKVINGNEHKAYTFTKNNGDYVLGTNITDNRFRIDNLNQPFSFVLYFNRDVSSLVYAGGRRGVWNGRYNGTVLYETYYCRGYPGSKEYCVGDYHPGLGDTVDSPDDYHSSIDEARAYFTNLYNITSYTNETTIDLKQYRPVPEEEEEEEAVFELIGDSNIHTLTKGQWTCSALDKTFDIKRVIVNGKQATIVLSKEAYKSIAVETEDNYYLDITSNTELVLTKEFSKSNMICERDIENNILVNDDTKSTTRTNSELVALYITTKESGLETDYISSLDLGYITSAEPVKAHYITAPFTAGNVLRRKTFWQYTLFCDVAEKKTQSISLARITEDRTIDSMLGKIGESINTNDQVDFGFLNFYDINFNKPDIPRIKTTYSPFSASFVCFMIKSEDDNDSALTQIQFTYSTPTYSYGNY